MNSLKTSALHSIVQQARSALVDAPDTVCIERARLATEAYKMYEDQPLPLCRARTFEHITRNMTLDLASNPVFAGNTSTRPRAWLLNPEYGFGVTDLVLVENDGLENILDNAIPQDILDFWRKRSIGGTAGPGHLAIDLSRVVHQGIRSILDECNEHRDEGNENQRTYRQAMIISLEALIHWANRYADAAQEAAQKTSDTDLREAHQRVATACRRVPEFPARNFFEGLQAIVLCHLALAVEGQGVSLSIGLPDRVLSKFSYEAEAAPATAVELTTAFMLKIASNSLWGRGSKTQAVTVGGHDGDGNDCCNALTLAFMEGANAASVGDPHLFLRWHEGLDPDVKKRAAELLAEGLSYPLLIHDGPMIPGLVDAGIEPQHAAEYCIIGCNEIGVPGLSSETGMSWSGTVNYMRAITDSLMESAETIHTMGDLLEQVEARICRRLTQSRKHRHRMLEHRAGRDPLPLTSALMCDCPTSGRDWVGGMRYQIPGVYERGLANATNCLAAIDEIVFNEQEYTIEELSEQLTGNHADESLRQRLLAAPKWGNDDDCADRWAVELVKLRERILDDIDKQFRDPTHVVCHVVRSFHHIDGMRLEASADGRRMGEPIASSIGAMEGTECTGPTAMLNSVLKLDAEKYYRGAYNLNLTLPFGQTSPDTVLQLIEGFFGYGGQELQINCFDPTTLLDAQAHPENHSSLVVRIAGLSSRFVDLSRREQDELIARAEAAH